MADEDVVIRRRLLTRTSALGKTGLKKCAESLLTLVDAFADESIEDSVCKQDMDALFWDLEQMAFEANKTDILSFTSQRELDAYEKLHAEIDASIVKVTSEIETLKTDVHVETTMRAYKEEYESLARVINELPSRRAIATDTTTEEKRSSDATALAAAVDAKLELRTKQFAVLMRTIQNLKATLDEDVVIDANDAAKQQQLADGDDDGDNDDDDDNMGEAPAPSPLQARDDDDDDMDGDNAATNDQSQQEQQQS